MKTPVKRLLKTLAAALAAAVLGGCMPALAAVPLRWNVETSRANPATFDVYRGETLELHADLLSYGRPIAMAGAVALYVQTNGMGDAWWTFPATASSNRVEAVLSPTNYPGDAKCLDCFLGGPATSYRAAFRLRVLGAPGPAPNALEPPVRAIDFSQVEVANAPWIKPGDGALEEIRDSVGQKQDALTAGQLAVIDGGPYVSAASGFDNAEIAYNPIAYLGAKRGPHLMDRGPGRLYLAYKPSRTSHDGDQTPCLGIMTLEDNLLGGSYTNFSAFASSSSVEAIWNSLPDFSAFASSSSVSNLSNTVAAWQTYWDGDDVRLTVTNYFGSADLPHLYLEQKVAEGGTNYFRRVWDETARHGAILSRVAALETNVAEKADRAWGFYDSHTGGYAPDGFTSISSPNVIIAGGMAYQRTVTTAGAVWVLTATDPTVIGGTTNGYFRISDDEGNALFEIAKGDRRTVGATATGLAMSGGSMTVTYAVQADEHPTIYLAESLTNTTWQAEESSSLASVSWTGASGAWTALVTPSAARLSLFVKATYEVGGKTYIRHAAPIGVEGGILCTDGVHKVRPVYSNGAVTWQVVQ